jgi:hypothetical protein
MTPVPPHWHLPKARAVDENAPSETMGVLNRGTVDLEHVSVFFKAASP